MARMRRVVRGLCRAVAALGVIWAAGAASAGATPARAEDLPPYKDVTLPFEKRVDDLVARLTIEEKVGLLQVNQAAVPRLGIPACRWGMEALHGISGGTIYPDGIGLAATWDPALLKRIAGAISDEARSRAGGQTTSGCILWCPTVNMARDPRWGRNEETYGEDPYLSAQMGVAYVQGLQGDDPKYLKAVATPKHFAVYSQEYNRHMVDARVSERALREYYLPPFEACFVEGKAASVMSAYNAINGVPCSANDWLLTQVLRKEWAFGGAVVTDSNAGTLIFSAHHFVDSDEKAMAAAFNAGVDMITGGGGLRGGGSLSIDSARQSGLIPGEVINRAVTRSLLVRFRLGQFDPPDASPYSKPSAQAVGSQEHANLALQAARESIVLLKNDPAPRGYGFDRLLPLDLRRITSIAVLGTYATQNQMGSYNSNPNSVFNRGTTLLDALKAAVGDRVEIRSALGSDYDKSAELARTSDLAIVVAGLDSRTERAGSDRTTLDLGYDQKVLLERVIKANPLTVVVLEGGSCVACEDTKARVPAMLMAWYPGEQGGTALAQVLLGQSNPSGRLPVTFYRAASDLPQMDDYEVITGRTYMYCKKPVTFPFGHGLSYTRFEYRQFQVEAFKQAPATPEGTIHARVEVANTGERDGEEVVQVYARQIQPTISRPIKQLVAFARVSIPRGQRQTVTLSIPMRGLAYWDTDKHQFAVDAGAYEIMVGTSSEDIRERARIDLH